MFELCDIFNIRLDDLFESCDLCLHVFDSSLDRIYLLVQSSYMPFTCI